MILGAKKAALASGAVVLALLVPPQGKATTRKDEEIRKEVQAFLRHYVRVVDGTDEKAMAALFVADSRFAWFTDGAKSYASPKEAVAGRKRYAGVTFKTTFTATEIVPLQPGLASVRTKFRTQLKIPNAPEQVFGGVITMLLQKHKTSGVWQVVLGHTSTPSGPRGQRREKRK